MKELIKRLARSAGYDIRKYRPYASLERLVAYVARSRSIDTIVDVGANTGQFGKLLRAEGYRGRILSIEPLAAAHEELCRNAANDPKWFVLDRMALGSTEGEVQIHRSHNLVSSSILPILAEHTRSAPESAYEATETVPMRRLDRVLPDWLSASDDQLLLKMDVQGYEDHVLDGLDGVLSKIAGIQTEVSMAPLYEGQVLHEALIKRMQEMGFSLYAFWPGFADPQTGRMLQYDVLMMREPEEGEAI